MSAWQLWWVTFFLCASGLFFYIEVRRSNKDEHADVRRLRQALTLLVLAVVFWPFLLTLLEVDLLSSPVTSCAAAVALLHIYFDASVFVFYKGALADYASSEAILERSAQVCTLAFAVATLLFADGNRKLSNRVMLPVFTSLFLATTAAMPSAIVRRQRESSPRWDALRRICISYAAGLMCVALATCIDQVIARFPAPEQAVTQLYPET